MKYRFIQYRDTRTAHVEFWTILNGAHCLEKVKAGFRPRPLVLLLQTCSKRVLCLSPVPPVLPLVPPFAFRTMEQIHLTPPLGKKSLTGPSLNQNFEHPSHSDLKRSHLNGSINVALAFGVCTFRRHPAIFNNATTLTARPSRNPSPRVCSYGFIQLSSWM